MTGAGINYDANGNMTGFGTGSGTATYDLFNRMVNVTTGNGTEWYGYSAANQRTQVSRANGTFETFFYGLGGELLGVYQRGTKANGHYYFSSASIRVWFAGRLIDGGGNSMVTDRLGSVVKNGTEALSYYPYGEQRTGNANADREKFATYSRDAVSGLDYAQNRYYSPQFGRFTTADPYRASGGPADPQSWNRYAYVENDPVNFGDPQGLQRRAPICYWQNNIGWEAGWYFTGFQSNICEEWGSEGGGGGRGGPLEWGGGGGASSNTIKKGKLNLYNVTKSGAKSDQAAQAFKNLKDNLAKDSDCMNWLAGGTRGAKVVSPELLDDIGTRIGVASRIELSGNNTPGIAAVALPSQAYDIVLNGEGAFFYGGDIPGLSAHLSSSSNAGNIFVLLHELSHVVGGLINDDDNDSTVNAANNSVIWQHCQKTVTGGN
ncbi:RHS repeat-associated core domain-containing protein [uncultured Paludibaculum sp.]|uniref:RHS repeat-associated core domain-containing protein n=1 Tax=uncultured Paludibaculum sp. TaxID=1765020 RepID=UPI00374CE3BA